MTAWPINDLALRAAAGDDLAFARLERQLRGKLRAIASGYYGPGLDRDDVRQEALIALHHAVCSWDRRRTPHFARFAGMVINRRLGSMVTAARRQKHLALNASTSLAAPAGPGSDAPSFADILVGGFDPARIVEARVDLELLAQPGWLSHLEACTLTISTGHNGGTGQLVDAANRLGVPVKMCDNALQRARRKAAARLAA